MQTATHRRIALLAACLFSASLNAVIIDKRVTIQPIFISNGTVTANPNGHLFESETDKIWSQAGIDVRFLAPATIVNASFYNIRSSAFSPGTAITLQALTQSANNGESSDPSVLNLYFVNTIDGSSSVYGYTLQTSAPFGFVDAQNGISIANSAFAHAGGLGMRDIIAHELGHSLGLFHGIDELGNTVASGPLNLMTASIYPTTISDIFPDGADLSQLNQAQIDRARSITEFVKTLPVNEHYEYTPVPEPALVSSFAALGAGLLGLIRARKRKLGREEKRKIALA